MDQTAFADLEQRLARIEGEFETLRAQIAAASASGPGEEAAPTPPPAPEENGTGSPAAPSRASTAGADPVVAWFGERGITAEVQEETEADRVFDRLAEYLGDHYADLHRIAGGIRWTILEREDTKLAVHKLSPSQKKRSLEFIQMLNNLALLDSYHYNEGAGRLRFQARHDPRLLRFINGQWLERYVLVKGRKCFQGATVDVASARNIHVTAPPSGRFEMDVIFLVGGQPIWIECKSREFRRDIGKYAERAQLLGIPLDRTVVAVQSFEDEGAEEAAADIPRLHGLSVSDTKGLVRRFKEIAAAEPAAAGPSASEEEDPAALADRLSAYLVQSQLSPLPESRKELLAALLKAAEEGMPATAGELRERMRSIVAAPLKPAAHPVLVAVRRGGGLLDGRGYPSRETSLTTEVAALAADDVAGLEPLCISAYEDVIKRKMPKVASRPDFGEVFAKVVGAGA